MPPIARMMTQPLPLDVERLTRVARLMSGPDASVRDLRRLSGGASQEIWAFDIATGPAATGSVTPCILRRAPGGTFQHGAAAGMAVEAAVIPAVEERGVPVPPVLHVLTDQDGLGHGFVMGAIEGETIARKILRDAGHAGLRAALPATLGGILARIHAVPIDSLPPLSSAGPADTLRILTARHAALSTPRPVFAAALDWLADKLPDESEYALVHGDFRLGNFIVDSDGVNAILDWEMVHLGDPMEDVAWLCAMPWRFGMVDLPVAGLGRREALYDAYRRASGRPVDPARVHWWETVASLRWGITCAETVDIFLGADPTVERALIARRASESEIDLLRLIYLA